MVARALWRSEALRVVPWLRPSIRLRSLVYGASNQGTTLRTSDLHNAWAAILNAFQLSSIYIYIIYLFH